LSKHKPEPLGKNIWVALGRLLNELPRTPEALESDNLPRSKHNVLSGGAVNGWEKISVRGGRNSSYRSPQSPKAVPKKIGGGSKRNAAAPQKRKISRRGLGAEKP